jgi:hypothetical protein
MSKKSVIQIVQEIANDIDTDEVNSIGDTTESLQIANIVKSTYDAIMSNRNWPHTARLVNMYSSADSAKPNIMTFADPIKELISVYYNKQKLSDTRLRYEKVKWIEPDDMLRVFYSRNTDDVNTITVNDNSQIYIVKNNTPPTYFTSFDDSTLVFDSYDSEVDDILKSSKTQVRAYVTPQFELRDDYIPDLPEEAFTFLIEEAKSKSAIKIAQKQDPKAEQESKRQNQWLSRKAWRVAGGIKYQRFGRGRGGISSSLDDPTFKQGKE